MRARMGLVAAGVDVELREVVLRDKPAEMITVSPKGTVPVLILPNGKVLEESLDIMNWALGQKDEEGLLAVRPAAQRALVEAMDSDFKPHLDRYKYLNRYPDEPKCDHRSIGIDWIEDNLVPRLSSRDNLFADKVNFADIAIFPFVRQFAHVNRDWFYKFGPRPVCEWLQRHLSSKRFLQIMRKYPKWESGTMGIKFPE
jgi:glutathione S-transferase